jgi:sugar lactone lactonase YvrE
VGTTSAAQTLAIKNTGSAPLTISSIALSGTNAAAFLRSGTCTSVAVNATCTLSLTFNPTTAGANSATLTINSNAHQNAEATVALSGTGLSTTLTQFVGTIDGPGFVNGTGTAARFNAPSGIAIDAFGSLYVTDTNSHLVRKITSAGVVTTLAGKTLIPGTANGTGTVAQFNKPTGIAINGTTLYVADTDNQLIRKLTTAGAASAFVGSAGTSGSTNGTGTAARFNRPQGLVTDSGGNVFVADTDNAIIRRATAAGVVTTFAGTAGSAGGTNGTGAAARFSKPTGIGRDASNNLFVADVAGQTIRRATTGAVVTTFAGTNGTTGSTNSTTGTSARFSSPSGAVVDTSGNVFIADAANGTIRRITTAGAVTTFAGTAGAFGAADGTGAAASFYRPVGIARDASNNLYVADPVAHTIRKITTGGVVSTFAGVSAVVGANDNTGSSATFRGPTNIVADASGNLFIADTGNHMIRRVTPAGVVTTFAGQAQTAGSANGNGTAARFNGPTGLAIDSTGNIFVADTGNSIIRKISPAGVVTTVAGTAGSTGSTNGTGTAARFRLPAALAVTTTGILYVADTGNYTIRRIVLSSGAVTTLAGSAGNIGTTEGAGTAARFGLVYGLGVDSSGSIYAADFTASTIRKITASGVTSTFAGTANSRGTTNATGTAARFSSPYGLAVDGSNNLYVSDYANCIIRKITSGAVVTSSIGTAETCRFTAGNAPAAINMPTGLTKVGTTLYVTVGNGVAKVENIP